MPQYYTSFDCTKKKKNFTNELKKKNCKCPKPLISVREQLKGGEKGS